MDKHDYKIFVDMDGVLCDFEGHFLHLFGKSLEGMPDEDVWKHIDSYGKSNFFATMPWLPQAKEMWEFLNQNFLYVKILSALGKSDLVDNQTSFGKRSWLRHNIPSLRDDDIILVRNKHQKRHHCTGIDSIIIDDTSVVIQEWMKKGGIGILHKNSADTINRLKEYV